MRFMVGAFFLISLSQFSTSCYASDYGVLLGFSGSHAFVVGLNINDSSFLYRLSASFTVADTRGKLVSEQKSNYGRTIEGDGDYYTSVDCGVGYYIHRNISILGEISIGKKSYYQNYIDGRFKDGGYHMIYNDDIIGGIGVQAGLKFNSGLGIILGYNTIRKTTFGLTKDF